VDDWAAYAAKEADEVDDWAAYAAKEADEVDDRATELPPKLPTDLPTKPPKLPTGLAAEVADGSFRRSCRWILPPKLPTDLAAEVADGSRRRICWRNHRFADEVADWSAEVADGSCRRRCGGIMPPKLPTDLAGATELLPNLPTVLPTEPPQLPTDLAAEVADGTTDFVPTQPPMLPMEQPNCRLISRRSNRIADEVAGGSCRQCFICLTHRYSQPSDLPSSMPFESRKPSSLPSDSSSM
jgi:hypothetical protein